MPINIARSTLIEKVVKTTSRLVDISGFVLSTDNKTTTLYPSLKPGFWYEIPTKSIAGTNDGKGEQITLYVEADANIKLVSEWRAFELFFTPRAQLQGRYAQSISNILEATHEEPTSSISNVR